MAVNHGQMAATPEGEFDLNVETVLEGWDTRHAVRELIANALDEQTLTRTAAVEIIRIRSGEWHIRDYGRGVRYTHLTQNENPEKLSRQGEVIGRFGVGLKDALAVLDRRQVAIEIHSAHGVITLAHVPKAGFPDVTTLHARVASCTDHGMIGTLTTVSGCEDREIEEAKRFFLRFNGDEVLEETRYGQILRREPNKPGRIYVKGLLVAEEANFAFSYNITVLTKQMLKALNRERTAVGRAAYSDRVKAMLLSAEPSAVGEILVAELNQLAAGTAHDEVRTWSDVGVRACQILNSQHKVVFVSSTDLLIRKEMVDRARSDGREIVAVPASVVGKLLAVRDIAGNAMQSLGQFAREWSASIELQLVPVHDLTESERAIFLEWRRIVALDGGMPACVRAIRVSETMRPSVTEGVCPAGLWEPQARRIIIHRDQLRSISAFAGTLLHEVTHARTGAEDVSREFESGLSDSLGRVTACSLRAKHHAEKPAKAPRKSRRPRGRRR